MTDPQQPPQDPGRPPQYGQSGQYPPAYDQPPVYGDGSHSPAPYGDAAPPMSRPGTVIAGCVMAWVGAAFGALLGLYMLSLQADSPMLDNVSNPDDVVKVYHVVGPLYVLWCVAVIVLAVLAFRGRSWAATTLLVMAAVSMLFAVLAISSGGGGSLLGGLWSVVSAVLIARVGRSKAWFAQQRRAAA